MLVVDLDGTVIPWSQQISPRDIAAARALRQEGVYVTIATGRLFGGSLAAARALGVTGGVACMNGSEIVDVESQTTIEGHYLQADEREVIRDALWRHGLMPALMRSRNIVHGRATEVHARYLSVWDTELREHREPLGSALWGEAADVLGVLASGETPAVVAAFHEVRETLRELEVSRLFDFTRTAPFLKVRSARADKGTALRALAAARGIDVADTVAVGDWNNDIPMLRVAGRSFAMGHANEEVRDHADEVLDANGETVGAIAEIASRVWGIEV